MKSPKAYYDEGSTTISIALYEELKQKAIEYDALKAKWDKVPSMVRCYLASTAYAIYKHCLPERNLNGPMPINFDIEGFMKKNHIHDVKFKITRMAGPNGHYDDYTLDILTEAPKT